MTNNEKLGAFPYEETEIEVVEKHIIKRVTIGNFISNIFDAFNITRGGIYSIKMILINPGQLARDYLGASRPRITAPFKILIFSTAIVLLLINSLNLFEVFLDKAVVIEGESQPDLKNQISEIFINYFNLILWTYIPVAAFLSYLFNRRRNFNYAENLVYQTFNLSITNIAVILCFPLSYFSVNIILVLSQLIMIAYMIYSYKVFFQKKWGRSIFEALIVFLTGTFIWFFILGILIVLIAVVKES